MRRIVHSDNIGTVGWTSIHAYMNYDDMQWLLKMEPRGNFTPTFYELPERWAYSWGSPIGMLRNMEYIKNNEQNTILDRPFYFSFPYNAPLLVALTFRGMKSRDDIQ